MTECTLANSLWVEVMWFTSESALKAQGPCGEDGGRGGSFFHFYPTHPAAWNVDRVCFTMNCADKGNPSLPWGYTTVHAMKGS